MAAPRNDNVKEKILDAATGLLDTQTFADISLAEIAAAAGFGSQSYFTQCFRRQLHQTPSQFRKAAKDLDQ